jgi:hypothetical protein
VRPCLSYQQVLQPRIWYSEPDKNAVYAHAALTRVSVMFLGAPVVILQYRKRQEAVPEAPLGCNDKKYMGKPVVGKNWF